MEIEINREDFLSVFQTAATIAPTRSPKPILQNVKLVAETNETTILATDLEIGVRAKVPGVTVKAAGSAVLPGPDQQGSRHFSAQARVSFP